MSLLTHIVDDSVYHNIMNYVRTPVSDPLRNSMKDDAWIVLESFVWDHTMRDAFMSLNLSVRNLVSSKAGEFVYETNY